MRNKSGFLLEALILVGVLAFIIYIGNAYLKSLVKESKEIEMKQNYSLEVADGSQSIVLAGGCFWGTEHYLAQLPGVTRTFVSYANGNKENPTYQEVCTGTTGHAEAVFVEYNPKRISLHYLLTYFFKTINPTSYHKQGNDVGSQYRSGIYFTNSKDREVIERFVQEEQKKYQKSIVTEVLPLTSIYPAEEYHQKYLVKNPNGYCHVSFDSLPPADAKLTDEKNPLWEYSLPTQEELEELSELSYRVTQEKATERPFTSEYDKEFRDGIYVDITNGQPLFSSEDKFDAGCGWPSFTKPLEDELIQEYLDKSHGMIRTEVTSKLSAAHLGHVFDDGPDGQLRYCINGASLRFVPKEKMQEEGYGYLLVLFE